MVMLPALVDCSDRSFSSETQGVAWAQECTSDSDQKNLSLSLSLSLPLSVVGGGMTHGTSCDSPDDECMAL